MLLAVMLALALAAAIPAAAQVVSQEIGQETESGEISLDFSVTGTGDYNSTCVAPLQFGNTANLQNAQGFAQYSSDIDGDFEAGGSEFVFEPSIDITCDQAVQQSAAASSTGSS